MDKGRSDLESYGTGATATAEAKVATVPEARPVETAVAAATVTAAEPKVATVRAPVAAALAPSPAG